MKKHLPLFFLPVVLLVCFLPCLARAQPINLNDVKSGDVKSDEIKPPQLLTPENGSAVKGAPEFFWTSAVLPRGFKGKYNLKVVPVSPGQSPGAAVASNQPVHQASMRRTGEAYPADGPVLKNGQTYAWCVQVLDANGSPVGENQGMSEVFTFSFESGPQAPPPVSPTPGASVSINTQPLQMTGIRAGSITINSQPLQMTGMRIGSVSINTQTLQMTGMRVGSITINTQPLQMTGMSIQSITINTGKLMMTGMGVKPITVKTDKLVMTGIRDEESNQPVEGKNTKIKKTGEKELDKKLDLPFKKTQKAVKAKDPGQITGKTGDNKLPGETPDLEPVQQSLPIGKAEPVDKTVSTPLKQKIEGLQGANVQQGIEPPAGTNTPVASPAGTETTVPGQKLKDVQESLNGKTQAEEKPANIKTGTDTGNK
jgi:hypothetical protein